MKATAHRRQDVPIRGDNAHRTLAEGTNTNRALHGANDNASLTLQLKRIELLLESIDARLAPKPSRRTPVFLRPKKLWKALKSNTCRPHRLWTYEQYSARPIYIPEHYHTAPAQKASLSFAMVTPSFEHGAYISDTIRSVLSQQGVHLAYTVQDGGSRDGTVERLKSFGASLDWRSAPDGGQAEAINAGFDRVSGDIMGWLNSDDTLLPGTLAYVANYFENHPHADIVYGQRVYINSDGDEIGRCILPQHDPETLKWIPYIPQETMFWRRRVWEKVGPLATTYQYALDWDFILRAHGTGFVFQRLPRFLSCFRVHGAQKGSSIRDIGERELAKLRQEQFGMVPTPSEISDAIAPYLKRQSRLDGLYRCGLARF